MLQKEQNIVCAHKGNN